MHTTANINLDIAGLATSTASSTLTLETRNTYDHAGRNTALYHKINTNAEKQLAAYNYDFRDRLVEKNLNPQIVGPDLTYLQSIDLAYNEQNWLTAINGPTSFAALSQDAIALCNTNPVTPNPAESPVTDADGNDLFKLDLYYEAPGLTFGTPTGQRNGNISQLVWQTRGRQRQGYSLQYDYLNRLTTSYYADINAAGTATTDNKYQENIGYADARGNISSMTRNGLYKTDSHALCWTLGQIDNMAYTYNAGTNRLQKIADTAPTGGTGNPQRNSGFNPGTASAMATYTYDVNGNMTNDPYKAVTLSYNHLNLPTLFDWGSGKTIAVLYDHAGKKLRKTVKPTAATTDYTQDYVNGLEYRTTGSGGTLTLEAIYHAEGRITPNGANYQYEYAIKDHLGNARISFADLNANNVVDVPGDILQESHYYPFGLNFNYGWMNNTGLVDSRYQYNGKELNDDFGLNLSDYGARWYDASLGRWGSVDPLAEKYKNWPTYNYVLNNPIRLFDPNGMNVKGDYYAESGTYLGSDGKKDDKAYVVQEGTYHTQIVKNKALTTILESGIKELQIKNSELLDRANWIYAEGKGNAAKYYAHTIQNIREQSKTENAIFKLMVAKVDGKVQRLDKNEYLSGQLLTKNGNKYNSTGEGFWDARKDPSKYTVAMQNTIGAVIESILHPELDPTNGCNQWIGGSDGSGEVSVHTGTSIHRFKIADKKYESDAPIINEN